MINKDKRGRNKGEYFGKSDGHNWYNSTNLNENSQGEIMQISFSYTTHCRTLYTGLGDTPNKDVSTFKITMHMQQPNKKHPERKKRMADKLFNSVQTESMGELTCKG